MAVEKSAAEKKAEEAKLILQEQLKLLGQSESSRLATTRQERALDEAKGQARGQELFGAGALGSVDPAASGKSLELQRGREGSLLEQRAASAAGVADRQAETDRTSAELDRLIAGRSDPNSEIAKLQRSAGREQINRALQSQLGQIRAAGNASQSGVTQALVGDALGGALQARSGLERDILLGGLQAAEGLTRDKASLSSEGLARKESLQSSGRAEEAQLRDRLEGLQGAIQDDTLRRQLINLDNRSKELFGRLSTEQNIVSQGVAERSGVRQQILSEVQAAESTRAQRESEALQQREIDKPTPNAGGKIICGELHRQGLMSDSVYAGDLAYAINVSADTREGYLCWAKHAVKIMRKSKLFTKLIFPIAHGWALEMAYRGGYVPKGSIIGVILTVTGEPICNLIGKIRRFLGRSTTDTYQRQETL